MKYNKLALISIVAFLTLSYFSLFLGFGFGLEVLVWIDKLVLPPHGFVLPIIFGVLALIQIRKTKEKGAWIALLVIAVSLLLSSFMIFPEYFYLLLT